MLQKLKLLIDKQDTSADALLLLLLDNATEFVVNYTHNDNIDKL